MIWRAPRRGTREELAIAKRSGAEDEVRHLGHRVQAIAQRRAIFKSRIRSIRDEGDPSEILAEAIRQMAPEDLQAAIFKRAAQINKEKFG